MHTGVGLRCLLFSEKTLSVCEVNGCIVTPRPQERKILPVELSFQGMKTNGCFGSSSTGSHLCPRSLDCARAGRHFCQLGSSSCGPCLHPLVENSFGRCVVKRRHAPHTISGLIFNLLRGCTKQSSYCCRLVLPHCITIISVAFSVGIAGLGLTLSYFQQLFFQHLHFTLSPRSFQSGIMSSFRPAQRPRLLTVCLYFFSVMSSVFIVAGSLALIIAAALWMNTPDFLLSSLPLRAFQPGDKKLAHSAQMYHYQHQKQQMLSFDKDEPKVPDSGASTDEENEDGDFTVYECPGLAPVSKLSIYTSTFICFIWLVYSIVVLQWKFSV
uniref:Neural proliferation, differentiation and control, 1b n=1 Tax=Acanthochromis polyacanthus TaxID=80966 RepID=A0A3Q1EVZ3_9TELE